jgi:hypothetical protein
MIKFVRWNILFKNQTTSSCQQVFYYVTNKPFRLSVIRLSVVAPSSVNKNYPAYQHPVWQMAVVRVLFCLYFKSEGQRWIFVIKNSILSSSKISRSHSTKLFLTKFIKCYWASMLLLCSALWVKQRCLSDDFIAINDKLKRLPWVFMCDRRRERGS